MPRFPFFMVFALCAFSFSSTCFAQKSSSAEGSRTLLMTKKEAAAHKLLVDAMSLLRLSSDFASSLKIQGNDYFLSGKIDLTGDTLASEQKALALLEQALSMGSSDAAYFLGHCYFFGVGLNWSLDTAESLRHKSIAYFNQSLDMGGKRVFLLGNEPYVFLDDDDVQWVSYYQKAAMKVSAQYAWKLGKIYLRGWHVAPDAKRGLAYVQQAIDVGSAEAAYQAALYYLDGQVGLDENRQQAVDYLLKSASLGSAPAMQKLGEFHMEGLHPVIAKDADKGLEYLNKAMAPSKEHAKGYTPAMQCLGEYYLNGRYLQRDRLRGMELLEQAIALGDTRTMIRLGLAYLDGELSQSRDSIKGVELLNKAISRGSFEARRVLGMRYLRGKGLEMDQFKGLEYFLYLHKPSEADIYMALGERYLYDWGPKMNAVQGLANMQKAIDLGSTVAIYRLAWCYLDGKGVEQDTSRALALFEKGLLLGDANCAKSLGECYLNGEIVTRDKERGLAYYHKAIAMGSVDAQRELGWRYMVGWYLESDSVKGLALIRDAASAGSLRALHVLSECYVSGTGVDVNLKYAKAYLQRARCRGFEVLYTNLME